MSAPSPEEVEVFLRDTYDMDADYYAQEREPEMTRETETALFQAVLYLLQARSFEVKGEAAHEARGYIERLQTAFYAPPLPDPFAEPSDDPPDGVWEHAGTIGADEDPFD